jgi:CTP:molybdopterin cytidylyltransferase MocA
MLAAIILSGGASYRMGTPKALLPYEGRTFLEHLLQVTNHPRIGLRRVVLGAGAGGIVESIPLRPEEVIVNSNWEKGQLSSLHAALRSLPAGTDGMLVCLIDHPLISRGLVHDLIERFYSSRQAIVLPVYKSRRGHPVIFSSALYEELLAAPLETGARAVVWAHRAEVSEMHTTEEGCVLNLNDPGALAEAREKTNPT